MPFSLGQILGGWRRKGDAKKAARFSDENSRRGRAGRLGKTSDVFGDLTSDVEERRPRDKEFSGEKRAAASPTIKNKSELAWQTIIAPHISEKGGLMGENKYVFKVAGGSNGQVIKQAIEERYGVNVVSVRTINMPPKPTRRGQVLSERSGFKKAMVELKEGQTINEF